MIQTLSDALTERGYETLTAVQEAVTNPELLGADLLVSAQTGSGKTVGFGLAIAETLLEGADVLGPADKPLALIIAPTRELALQVMRELSWLYAKTGARVVSCVGGMDMRDERRALDRGAHIVVGTPGRLRDHIQRNSLDMSALRAIVLDEADEMLDLGFREDLEFMLGEAPPERRTLMFSATVPASIARLAEQYQRDAVRVTTLSGTRQHSDIAYQAVHVAQRDAENAIINVLRYHDAQNAIVFANTRAMVSRLTARFANRGFAVVALSGELSQTERTHALQAMRDGRAKVCVATDVAARGIDLPNLDLVIHAELPTNAEGLLHRSGRTGRAGRKGISALIVPSKIVKKAERLLKFAKIDAEWVPAPSAEDILRRDEERLLADPVWTEEVSEDEAEFSAKLLALHSPERIAAAYLRLYRSGQSAPEDLSGVDTPVDREDRKPFGPSVWFSLSVGRDDRAEPRWLLPLVCKVGGLDKTAIGAIRIQQSESFVELTEASVPGFLAGLGEGGLMEDGVRARRLDGPPDLGGSGPRKPRPDAKPRPDVKPMRKPRAEVMDEPIPPSAETRDVAPIQPVAPAASEAAPKAASAAPKAAPRPKASQRSEPRSEPRPAPAPEPAPAAPAVDHVADGSVVPFRKPRHPKNDKGFKHTPRPAEPRPKGDREKPAGASERRYDDKPKGKTFGKTFGKPGGKPAGQSERRYDDKPKAKYDRKPERSADGAPPAKPRADATDTSKRFVPPGGSTSSRAGKERAGAKGAGPRPGGGKGPGSKGPANKGPGGKPNRAPGGNAPPRRPRG